VAFENFFEFEFGSTINICNGVVTFVQLLGLGTKGMVGG
jgi:hypothetical protein